MMAYEPFNGENNCRSFVNDVGYKIGVDSERINKLTKEKCKEGSQKCEFTIVELEVWEVVLEEEPCLIM